MVLALEQAFCLHFEDNGLAFDLGESNIAATCTEGDLDAEQITHRGSAGLHRRRFPSLVDLPSLLREVGGNRGGSARFPYERFIYGERVRHVSNASPHRVSAFRPRAVPRASSRKGDRSPAYRFWYFGACARRVAYPLAAYGARQRPHRPWLGRDGAAMGYGVSQNRPKRGDQQLSDARCHGRWRMHDAYVSTWRSTSHRHDRVARCFGRDVSPGKAQAMAAIRS